MSVRYDLSRLCFLKKDVKMITMSVYRASKFMDVEVNSRKTLILFLRKVVAFSKSNKSYSERCNEVKITTKNYLITYEQCLKCSKISK